MPAVNQPDIPHQPLHHWFHAPRIRARSEALPVCHFHSHRYVDADSWSSALILPPEYITQRIEIIISGY
jgi:hypothetical protein